MQTTKQHLSSASLTNTTNQKTCLACTQLDLAELGFTNTSRPCKQPNELKSFAPAPTAAGARLLVLGAQPMPLSLFQGRPSSPNRRLRARPWRRLLVRFWHGHNRTLRAWCPRATTCKGSVECLRMSDLKAHLTQFFYY